LSREEPGEKEMAFHSSIPVFLPGEFHGHRSLVGYSSWVAKIITFLLIFLLHNLSLCVLHCIFSIYLLSSLAGPPVVKQLMKMLTMVPGQGGQFQSVCFP